MSPKNVYVIGAQCTGKSTIVRALESHFCATPDVNGKEQPRIIREVAREVLKKYDFSRDDITTDSTRALELQQRILRAQYEAETNASKYDGQHWYISDRSGLDPIAYTRVFVGDEATQKLLESPEWIALEWRMKAGIVALCEAGTSWLQDDGVRLMPKDSDDWLRVERAFRELLQARGIEYILIPRDLHMLDHRVSLVVDALSEKTQTLQNSVIPADRTKELSV